ncbi:hypothetical protein V0U79_06400 [Hyphobacterium sp. HN65]|uniref:Uncharacterized protein n=1 Tax=Hyphobacterium lacteum TaxID=3116575 RepID=A0ABU7LQS5_9PROT|nr:hypothetical protein [Hyphobacterium sp. HN65]MEE2525991.1 hypothetical protein [Hyphobacterium sp. HN65]
MTPIRGLLTYVPTRNASRVAPVSSSPDSQDRPPRQDLPSLSVVPTETRHTNETLITAAAAYELSAQPRRRGLKADASERARFHHAYARPAHMQTPPPAWERRA